MYEDEEGNFKFPESLDDAKKLLRSMTESRSVSTTAALSRSSSTTTTMVTTATAQPTVTAAVTTTTHCTTMVSTCAAFPRPALAAVPQPTAAPKAAVTTTTRCVTRVPTAIATPVKPAACVPAPVSRSSGQLSAPRLAPCIIGGETIIPPSAQITRYESALLDLKTEVDDKTNTIARLESDLAKLTHHWEGQINQLQWLDNMVNEKEANLFDRDLAISALESTLSDKSSLITAITSQYKADMIAGRKKFIAIYNHCRDLALDMQRKDDYITTLLSSEEKTRQISLQQQTLTKSLLALKKKKRKTRFIDGQHSLYHGQTEPSLEVKQEMSLAAARIRKEKEQQDRADLIKLSDAVDRLALKYDRYNMITVSKIHNTRCDPDGLPCIVPREMMGLWLFADSMEEPNKEESAMYEFHLQLQVRPPPIFSPNLPKPTVNWATLNKHKRKNLPDPEIFPIQSVPIDPNFYLDLTKYKTADQHRTHDYTGTIPLRITQEECGCARCVPPFGQMYGLMTDMGVIPMPDTSVHGYRWDEITASWVIATGG